MRVDLSLILIFFSSLFSFASMTLQKNFKHSIMAKEDLLFTIDSDVEVEDDSDSSVEDVKEEVSDINPNFEFSIGDEVDEIKDWEAETDETIKDVNLDEIIEKKRGDLPGEEEGSPEEEEEEHDEMEQGGADEEEEDPDAEEFYESAPSNETNTTFQELQLSRPILKSIQSLSFTSPTPIQSSTIPIALLGKDIVAGAQTGSGKTAAYLIPLIERLIFKNSTSTKAIILAPTRELAIQVYDVGRKLGQFVKNLSFGLAVGGLNLRQQEQQLKSRPDIVIATPGRLIDHIRNSPSFSVEDVQVLVIDEADRMLEEGFQEELTEILSLIPKQKRQTLLFSATMNTKVQDLVQLSLNKPVRVMIDPPKTVASRLEQQFVRIRKRESLKPALLFQLLRKLDGRIVVFVSRKEMAHKLRVILGLLGLKVAELHGALTQEQRLANMKLFMGDVNVLVCTDLAARGLDIRIEYVVNFDMPKTYEIYLHRVGRTARAGRKGTSITFVGESNQDRAIVKAAINNGRSVARKVDWNDVEAINKRIDEKESVVDEVLQEEKEAKEILRAEMQLNKASNLIKYEKDIHSRPKRTWFKSDVMGQLTKHGKKVNSKKRKANEDKKENEKRSYKKTKTDRSKKSGKRK
ncbi:Drs1 nucleolar DEAD-box protein [Candida orthopsilosis Co 90-125]|uniref:RNA helicase n=1 Tax=Candida orthopsilosis (strain 90-125) TaxID=1136231 RepID=H8X6I7_CANO9|nr:Drs1 nucleolar DEAD-box protein [Candida orthopsilosis Co 90-125]CCG23598.1 Drs1 nucleolar DEAD-box protein [Candida orthopsilosis Co 90-125]